MDKKTIAFYISSHGFDHITRCIAIIQQLLETSNYHIYIACGEKQNKFAKLNIDKNLERITFNNIRTDVGLLRKERSHEVDVEKMNTELSSFIVSLPPLVVSEVDRLKDENVTLIISDISILGILVGEELGVNKIGISNFTWYNQYTNYNISQPILDIFNNTYKKLDYFLTNGYVSGLFHLKCPIEDIGLVSREMNHKRVADKICYQAEQLIG